MPLGVTFRGKIFRKERSIEKATGSRDPAAVGIDFSNDAISIHLLLGSPETGYDDSTDSRLCTIERQIKSWLVLRFKRFALGGFVVIRSGNLFSRRAR